MVMNDTAEQTIKKPKREYIPEDPGLSVDQVGAELGVTRSSARRLIVSGKIPHYVVAAGQKQKVYRVRRSVLMRWRESQERQSVKTRNRAAPAVVSNGGQEGAANAQADV
jgi:excisionase family DNA binding protein